MWVPLCFSNKCHTPLDGFFISTFLINNWSLGMVLGLGLGAV